ncbi:MAG: hypothetical protein RBR28_02755 [Lentimicrobium sp.]|jgi:tetratricopeptide (TPR) repeat protein|nr:hypothetical protein [Lentimicrobium sp.]
MILRRKNGILLLLILFFPLQTVFAQQNSTAYLKAAIEATNQKKYVEAIKYCDTAVKLNSTLVEAYFHRGYNRLKLKDFTGARVDFTICLELNRNNLSAYLYRAYTNQKLGNTWEAGQDYLSARKIDALETFTFFTLNLFRSGFN